MGSTWGLKTRAMYRVVFLLLAVVVAVEASPCPLVGGNGLSEAAYPDPEVHEYLTRADTARSLPCDTTLTEVQISASADDGHSKAVKVAKKAVMKAAKKQAAKKKKASKKANKASKKAKKASKKAKATKKKQDLDTLKAAGVDPMLLQGFGEPVKQHKKKKVSKWEKLDQEYQKHIDAVDMLF